MTMVSGQGITLETLINWNEVFPEYTLKPDDLKKPHALMEALFHIFDRLGIDKDYVLAPLPKEDSNESALYYSDLLPVINMTRVVNHLLSVTPETVATLSMMHFLQPTPSTSRSIIMLLLNLMLFAEQRLIEIAPHEKELYAKQELIQTLEYKKNYLLEMLNKQAEEKGDRAQKLEKLALDVRTLEEELNQEKQLRNEERLIVEQHTKSNQQKEMLLEQKKVQHEALLTEVARKKALRVYDAEDVKAKVEQAALNVQEAEEKLNILRDSLMKKENNLKSLQAIQPSLDTSNGLLNDITKVAENIKDYEMGDLDEDCNEGELNVLNTELSDLDAALSELRTVRAELDDRHRQSQASRQHDTSHALSALRTAEEEDRKRRLQYKNATQRIAEIKELTVVYDEQKIEGLDQLAKIEKYFTAEISRVHDAMINKMAAAENKAKNILKLQHSVHRLR